MIKKKPPIDGELGDGPNHHCFGEKNPDYPHDQVERGGHSVHLHLGGAGGPGFGLPVRLMPPGRARAAAPGGGGGVAGGGGRGGGGAGGGGAC
jgi:hypothetical protein